MRESWRLIGITLGSSSVIVVVFNVIAELLCICIDTVVL